MSKDDRKEPAASSTEAAIIKLEEVEKMLNKTTQILEGKIEQELKTALANAKTNKRAAMMAMKKKKRLTEQLTRTDGQLSTLEIQKDTLRNAIVNREVVKVVNIAAKALKAANEYMDPEKVHELMEDITEQNDTAREISETLAHPVGFAEDFDEEELEAELEELLQESTPPLPSVPTDEPVAARSGGAKGTKELRKELAELA